MRGCTLQKEARLLLQSAGGDDEGAALEGDRNAVLVSCSPIGSVDG